MTARALRLLSILTLTTPLLLPVGAARAELVELTDGSILQGDVLSGDTTDEGLALRVYETGGVVTVKWEHVLESRRRQLRLEMGIDLPEETVEQINGHRVLLVSGETVVGVAENPRGSEPLRLKTRTGVKEYDRSAVAGPVESVRIDGLAVYTAEELYQRIRDENPPETAAAHKALAQRCMNITAYERAKEHLLAAKADALFMETAEGKAVEGMLRQSELMIRAKGASELRDRINQARYADRWNDAFKLLARLDADYKDETVRKAVGFDLLEARVVKGRDAYFGRRIASDVDRAMDALVEAKARERKPLRDDPDARPGAASPGTLAAARQWVNKDLYVQTWEKVAATLDLTKDELERFWKGRSAKQVRRASYGSGSFIVVKKATAKPGAPTPPQRRPPGERPKDSGKNVPAKPAKPDKPLTDEEWWETVGPSDRARWLEAVFVETSGMFEILRAEETPDPDCGGLGYHVSMSGDGSESRMVCPRCNGSGVFRTVTYR